MCGAQAGVTTMTVSAALRSCVGCVLALAWALATPRAAHACTRTAVSDPIYEVDPTLQASDRESPSTFMEVSAFAYRVSATDCNSRGVCTFTTCGDAGAVEVTFIDPADDQTPRDQLGYRVALLAGTLPPSMLKLVDKARPLTPALTFEVGFDDVSRLDAVIALIAIDRAGNESAASAPIRLRDSGCTRTWLNPMCMGEVDRGNDPVDCSARSPGAARGPAALWLVTLPWAVALARWRRKRDR